MPADHLRVELRHAAGARELVATGTGARGRTLANGLDPGSAGSLG
jgi:hypothetical protein